MSNYEYMFMFFFGLFKCTHLSYGCKVQVYLADLDLVSSMLWTKFMHRIFEDPHPAGMITDKDLVGSRW